MVYLPTSTATSSAVYWFEEGRRYQSSGMRSWPRCQTNEPGDPVMPKKDLKL